MEVLHQSLLEAVDIGDGLDEDRHRLQPGPPSGPPPPLAGDQLVLVLARLPHQDRLEDPDLADRGCQGDIASSSKRVRGCRGLGLMLRDRHFPESRDRDPGPRSGSARPGPCPSPLRRATADLLG